VGVFLNRLGDYENALKKAREAIDLNPDYPDAHFVARCSMQGLEDHQGVIPEYQKAISLKSNYWEALVNLGNAYLELDRSQEALENKAALEGLLSS
jgi:tetratricopeptide (TPR) repeat protein